MTVVDGVEKVLGLSTDDGVVKVVTGAERMSTFATSEGRAGKGLMFAV